MPDPLALPPYLKDFLRDTAHIPFEAPDAAGLRLVPKDRTLFGGELATLQDTGISYIFCVLSVSADDGINVIKPFDVLSINPGRWKKLVGATPTGSVSALFIEDEIPVTSNGQTAFSLSQAMLTGGFNDLYVNGIAYAQGTDYTIVGAALTWLDTPFTLQTSDNILVKFQIQ